MKIWKVYAQCCYNPHPVQEISEHQFNSLIDDLIIDYTNVRDCSEFFPGKDDDKESNLFFSALYELIMENWKSYGILDCGDYCLKKTDDDESPSRPCMGGYEDFLNSDIRKKIEKIAATASI